MMLLVTATQPLENLDSFILVGGINDNFLKPSGQGAVFFNVFALLLQRRGTDTLNLTAGQCRLEHVGRIDCTFRTAVTNQGVQFINE